MSLAGTRARARARPSPQATVVAVIFVAAYGTNVPTPLLLLYEESLGLGSGTTAGIFAMYGLGLIVALIPAGALSDRWGRRPATVLALALALASTVAFVVGRDALGVLLAARFVQGGASGVVFAVGTAWLRELDPDAEARTVARRSAISLSLGFALGPLVTGGLAEWAPGPLVTPYLTHLGLSVIPLALATRCPETAGGIRRLLTWVPMDASQRRRWLVVVVPTALCIFAFPSTSLTVVPMLLRDAVGEPTTVGGGLMIAATLAMGALVQPAARRLGDGVVAVVGVGLGVAGIVLCVAASAWTTWVPLAPAALLLGSAYGFTLFAGLTAVDRVAHAQRGLITSMFYCIAYTGFAVPLVISAAAEATGFTAPLAVFAGVGLAMGAWLWTHKYSV